VQGCPTLRPELLSYLPLVPVMISNDSVSSTTLTNCSRFILHPRAPSLRVAVAFVSLIVIFFFAVVFLFLLFVFGLLPRRISAGTRALVWLESSRTHLCLSNCSWRLACASAVLFRALIGTLNSRLQSVQTPTAGVVVSHLATLRRRWTMDISSFAFGIPRCLGTEGVNLTAAAGLPAHGFPTFPNDDRNNR